ncbi:RuBisCO large subunit C-terminal-like domain-containing protein [Bifidobacterium psychraerophilum]|jgi:ribulose-bisphosphate carboxylase large chain|nr:RuBisCO large subunit C-terminal-like domain-containing protein [Bifidobacterium psychraerophilum]
MMSSSASIEVEYEILGDVREARQRAESIAVEQSHEFPREYAPAKADRSLGRLSSLENIDDNRARAVISYPEDLTAFEFPQLLVVLLGNASLLPGVRLTDIRISDAFAQGIGGGPKLGIDGIRRVLGVPSRPLLATALKPVGLDTEDIAKDAYDCAFGGVDVIKDDQGLGNQRWSPFAQRVPAVSQAIREANERSGGHSVYLPCFNPPIGHIQEHVDILLRNHVGGCLAVPGITGFDVIGYLRDNTPEDFIIYAHPAFLGGWTASPDHGIREDLLFGHLLRLAGADSVIFPSFGGRFTFSKEQCGLIARKARDTFAGLNRSLPSPGGGMSVERIPELVDFYGNDTMFLIGGALHASGSLAEGARKFREAAERFS